MMYNNMYQNMRGDFFCNGKYLHPECVLQSQMPNKYDSERAFLAKYCVRKTHHSTGNNVFVNIFVKSVFNDLGGHNCQTENILGRRWKIRPKNDVFDLTGSDWLRN